MLAWERTGSRPWLIFMPTESPFACVMSAIAAEQRTPHLDNARNLFSAVVGIRELENGYAFCLGNHANILEQTAQFIELEKLCCPFFGFAVIVEPEGGNIWLHLTGREGVKPFIQAEIADIVGRPFEPVTRGRVRSKKKDAYQNSTKTR